MSKEFVKSFYGDPANVKAYYEAELNGLKWNGSGQGISLCPFHDDSKESLSIKDSGAYFCHACNSKGGDIISFHMLKHALNFSDALKALEDRAGISSETKKKIVKTYDYKDASGNLIFQAVRYEPKGFSQRRPDPNNQGKWIYNLHGVQLIPYNLPEVIKSEYCLIVEGEKDVESLKAFGFIASCNAQGAGKWKAEYNSYFSGKRVYFLPDNDKPGLHHALQVAKSLHGKAASVKVIELPGLPEKGDVSDWIQARQAEGKAAEEIKTELRAIVKAASEWQEPGTTAPAEGNIVENITEWPDPIPFNDYSGLPDFPVGLLPDMGREIVKAVSEVNQVDLGLTASNYLSVLSASLRKKAKIKVIPHVEPLNVFTCSIYPSGNRKSSTQGKMTKPLYEYQERMQEALKKEIRDSQNAYRIREARLARLQKQAANANDYTQRKELEIEAAAIAKEIEENPVVKSPLYVMDDVTTEALTIYMAENNEAMSIFSTEGGIFQTMAGRYDKGVNIDLYLKAHAGDPSSVHRVGREAKTMQAPCLTMCLSVQPDVIREIGRNEQFKGRGLLARFLYSLCKSQVGYRERQIKAVPDDLLKRYQKHIFSLMEIPQSESELKFTPEAQTIWNEFYNDVEADMRPGGSLEYLTDWGSKLPGAVARIAGLLHFAEHGAEAITEDISASIAVAACVIGGYFKEHALATFGLMQADPQIEAAKKILSYIARQNPASFKGRDILRHSNFKTMDDVLPGLKVLVERSYIRETEAAHSGTGRPEAITYGVNPKIKNEYANKPLTKLTKAIRQDSFVNIVSGL